MSESCRSICFVKCNMSKIFELANTYQYIHEFVIIVTPPPQVQKPLACQGLFIVEDARLQSDKPHSVRLLWTGDQPDVETST
jgi:hypothetical protein